MAARTRRLHRALVSGLASAGITMALCFGIGLWAAANPQLRGLSLARLFSPWPSCAFTSATVGVFAFVVAFVLQYLLACFAPDAGSSGHKRIALLSQPEREIRDVKALVGLCLRRAGRTGDGRRGRAADAQTQAQGEGGTEPPSPDR